MAADEKKPKTGLKTSREYTQIAREDRQKRQERQADPSFVAAIGLEDICPLCGSKNFTSGLCSDCHYPEKYPFGSVRLVKPNFDL